MAAVTVGNGSGKGSRNRVRDRKNFESRMDDINFPTQRRKAEELARKLAEELARKLAEEKALEEKKER